MANEDEKEKQDGTGEVPGKKLGRRDVLVGLSEAKKGEVPYI